MGTNRDYSFTVVPEEIKDFKFIKMEARGNLSYDYEVAGKCVLYLLVHSDTFKNDTVGKDLKRKDWERTDLTVQAAGGSFSVYKKEHKKRKYDMSSPGPWALSVVTGGTMEISK